MRHPNTSLPRTALVAGMVRFAASIAIFAALGSPVVSAQDSSGDALLSGSFRFRYVAAVNTNATGVVTEVTTAEGVINFLGNGTYTINTGSQWNDNTVSNGAFQTIPSGSSGSYAINTAGIGSISNPNPNPNIAGDVIQGTFSQGVFTGSSTEYGIPDMFVAIAVGPIPTNATFTSSYWIGALDFAIGTDVDLKNALFQINPNGSGGLGPLTLNGQVNSDSNVYLTQNVSGATYNFASDGNAQFSIPAPSGVTTAQVMVSGARTMYVSADGNFMLGWTPNGYDILFGVKAMPSTVPATDSLFTGLYYLGGIGDNPTVSGTENCGPFGFWGSENADGAENEVVHQRLYLPACANFVNENDAPLPYDFGTWGFTTMASNGQATEPYPVLGFLYQGGSTYAFGDTGAKCVPSVANAACAFVAISNTFGTLGLTIGVHAPNVAASGLFLNPIGVVHAASWDPITTSVAPGELLTLFGSFGSSLPTLISTGGQPFPNVLGTIQVYINGTQSPIYYISPTQISVIAPFELANATTETVEIQVNNGGLLSNEVSVYLLNDATPGIFAASENGIGPVIAEHANGSLVCDPTIPPCSGSVAQPGETIILALAGMGLVTPSINDGGVPSTTSLSYINDFPQACDNTLPGTVAGCALTVFFHDYDNNVLNQPATVAFAGLYPGLASLYQMNVTVPSTVGPGDDIYVEVVTPYADNIQVTVPVGGAANAAANVSLTQSRIGVGSNIGQPMVPPTAPLPRKPAEMTPAKRVPLIFHGPVKIQPLVKAPPSQ